MDIKSGLSSSERVWRGVKKTPITVNFPSENLENSRGGVNLYSEI